MLRSRQRTTLETMIYTRKSSDRGYADHGWLKSFHSFSFAGYYDARYMGWGNLRVINEDRIAPRMGFGTHGHRDMEIISVVLAGNLAHQDSMGNVEGIPAGSVQRMSAGRGVQHSEFNHAPDQTTHFFQIWIEPDVSGIVPEYEQTVFNAADGDGTLALLGAPAGQNGALTLHADARLYRGLFDGAQRAELTLPAQRKAYVHVMRGALQVNGVALAAGDALLLENESLICLDNGHAADVLVFDLRP